MKKKNYILVLTFLCMLCGQMSYGQSTWCSECHSTGQNILHFVGTPIRFVGGLLNSLGNPGYNNDYTSGSGSSYGDSSSSDDSSSTGDWGSEGADDGWVEWTPADYGGGPYEEYYDEFEDYYDIYFGEEGFYYSEEDLNKYLSYYCSLYPQDCVNDNISWYLDKDGDGYHSETKNATVSPGVGWIEGTSKGADCDDNLTTGKLVYQLNKCGKCAVEPADGKCPCNTSAADLKAMFGLTDAKAAQVANILNKYAGKFGIDTKEKLQHFLAQAGKETSGFKNLVKENLDYSVKNILDTWPSRFSQTDTTKKNPDEYAHNPVKLGEYVYGYRNGNTQPGDGNLFRGRGAIQITGRTHYTNFSKYYKDNFDSSVDVLKNPDLISSNLEIAIISGLWFFKTEVIDRLKTPIDANTAVINITNKINSGETKKKKEERKKIFDEKVKPNAKCN